MNKTNLAILVLGALACIIAAGLAFGDLTGEAAWGFLGVCAGSIGGILVPAPE